MFERLVESNPRRRSRLSPSLSALGIHAGLVAGALRLAGDGHSPPSPRILPIPVVYDASMAHSGKSGHHEQAGPESAVTSAPAAPVFTDAAAPSIDADLLATTANASSMAGRAPGLPEPLGSDRAIADFARTSATGSTADQAPTPLRVVQAAYPPQLREAGVEGAATIEFVVDTLGMPQRADGRVVRADSPAFGAAALAAALASRFTPGRSGGRRVAVKVRQVVRFRLQ